MAGNPNHRGSFDRKGSAALIAAGMLLWLCGAAGAQPEAAALPDGVKAVWGIEKAYRQETPARERISINGLWRWQPASAKDEQPPAGQWGFFKVPGCWPGIQDYMQQDCQTVFTHPSWQNAKLGEVSAAWYQREIEIPAQWTGRRVVIEAKYVNSIAAVFIDGKKVGEIRFPGGEVDITPACKPGGKHVLSLHVVALPLKSVMLSFSDTASSKTARGSVARRGLCGDAWLIGRPAGACISNVKIDTSVRKGQITFTTALADLAGDGAFTLRARVTEKGQKLVEFTSKPFKAGDLKDGRIAFAGDWKPAKLWDIHTPQNQYEAAVELLDASGKAIDTSHPQSFGFREFWIDGRDFHLNGTRIFLCALYLDNAQVGAAWASYDGAKESLRRLKDVGINFVYTHNYGCEPGTHLAFDEVLKAADDVGMLVSFSQPHFGQYDWKDDNADQNNGYAKHARFYVDAAGSHPSVVMYSMSHNATGYAEDMNPDLIDGIYNVRDSWALNNVKRAQRAEAIVKAMDPGRIVYHHSSGNLGPMHTSNFYTNMAPLQELDDWFEHWATQGVKPMFTCEYMVPCAWDFTMYRGWYKGSRTFGSAVVPWEYCIAEWSAQFLGDKAYQIGEEEKKNIRWEAGQFKAGRLWHRWDYPYQVGSRVFENEHKIIGAYLASNWKAFRGWGVSAISPWEFGFYWSPRAGVNKDRKELKVDWENLQRPGLSADYIDRRYERLDLAYERADWVATADGQAVERYNRPLLGFIAGKPSAFTSKDHNFLPGETVEKQLIVINNSRQTVSCDCAWALTLPQQITGQKQVTIETGQQIRIPLKFELPGWGAARAIETGRYMIKATFRFSTGETQEDSFVISVDENPMPVLQIAAGGPRIALFDPRGETAKLLTGIKVPYQSVDAKADLSNFDLLIVGKGALTADNAAPDIGRVREGLNVIVFEQTPEALEQRLGFRIAEYGLRQIFGRVPDHPLLAGIDAESLRDWRGEATIQPPRLKYELSPRYAGAPAVKWCGIEVSRVWRCGNRGNVASVLIEKPARGDFLPILDGGYSLQYSPLVLYREGKGHVLFCQMDVTGRAEDDPAASRLVRNILSWMVSRPAPTPQRQAVYAGDEAGRRHLEFSGIAPKAYEGGKLSGDQVLIVGTGAGAALAKDALAVADFLKSGGRIAALGLDEKEAAAILPFKLATRKSEHIAACFDPPRADSLLSGISPADVHNRNPREIPLVSSGAKILGDGVLAENGGVAFCQLPPYALTAARGELPGMVIDATDAAEGKQSALVTLGMTGGYGCTIGQKLKVSPQAGKTYTFAVMVKGVGGPVAAHLEVERAGSPWDRTMKQNVVSVSDQQWTDLHVTFQCDKPYPEGWQAYLYVNQEGGRFRADCFRFHEGEYVPLKSPGPGAREPEGGKNLFENAGFEAGIKPWSFVFHEQLNVRRTYRRTSFMLSRLLANLGVRARTPLLAHFSTPASEPQASVAPSVVRNGDFAQAVKADAVPEPWQFSAPAGPSNCVRERMESGGWALRMKLSADTPAASKTPPSLMLSQNDVPVKQDQWYRISLKARAQGMGGKPVTLAIQDMRTWKSLIEYQNFTPQEQWRTFQFLVQGTGTAPDRTRLQIWHSQPGTLWLADVAAVPVPAPVNTGRWLKGLYLDEPEDWDDPYRFFRW